MLGTHPWCCPLGSQQMVAEGVAGVSVAGPGFSWSYGQIHLEDPSQIVKCDAA